MSRWASPRKVALQAYTLLEDAPHAYEIFQKNQDGAFKIVLNP